MRSHRTAKLAALIATNLALPVLTYAEPATPDEWQFEVTPYLFGSALSGTTGIGSVTSNVDGSFKFGLVLIGIGLWALLLGMFEHRRDLQVLKKMNTPACPAQTCNGSRSSSQRLGHLRSWAWSTAYSATERALYIYIASLPCPETRKNLHA